jgi:putative oxidoreductase
MMHNFWAMTDPLTYHTERVMFLKNLTMLGGALVICCFGADPLSLDALLNRDRELIS